MIDPHPQVRLWAVSVLAQLDWPDTVALAVRALEHAGFGEEDFNRLILKLAFLDLPLDRAQGVEKRANRSLSRMLHGLATERRAAGRTVWGDTARMIALAPLQDSATS